MYKTIKRIADPVEAIDGKVKVNHVFSRETMVDADPLLLLDAFDSTDPDEYTSGFPMHPHRGIKTITYLWKGSVVHKDSLGHEDGISDGEVQWMTGGSGIFHEEMFPPVDRLCGVQIWLNLKKEDKWANPAYKAIRREEIKEIPFDGGYVRVLVGSYQDQRGFESSYQLVDYYDIHLDPDGTFETELEEDDSLVLFTLYGRACVEGQDIETFHGAITSLGDKIRIENPTDKETSVLFFKSRKIKEPIAWWPGPIVMNTEEELERAYREIEEGTFLKEDISMDA